jgi:hypothetical protein
LLTFDPQSCSVFNTSLHHFKAVSSTVSQVHVNPEDRFQRIKDPVLDHQEATLGTKKKTKTHHRGVTITTTAATTTEVMTTTMITTPTLSSLAMNLREKQKTSFLSLMHQAVARPRPSSTST